MWASSPERKQGTKISTKRFRRPSFTWDSCEHKLSQYVSKRCCHKLNKLITPTCSHFPFQLNPISLSSQVKKSHRRNSYVHEEGRKTSFCSLYPHNLGLGQRNRHMIAIRLGDFLAFSLQNVQTEHFVRGRLRKHCNLKISFAKAKHKNVLGNREPHLEKLLIERECVEIRILQLSVVLCCQKTGVILNVVKSKFVKNCIKN